jgi:hypothetical protein
MKTELLDGAPPGAVGAAHLSGWIQVDSFTKWFTGSFTATVKASPADPVVLVLNGHYSHTRNIDVIDLARANGVSIVCLPPQCMQPLDVSFMQPFKTYYR